MRWAFITTYSLYSFIPSLRWERRKIAVLVKPSFYAANLLQKLQMLNNLTEKILFLFVAKKWLKLVVTIVWTPRNFYPKNNNTVEAA